ncbi:hypothetical protein M0R19_08130 [Candidatus Pacearchaeota archaeon]|nr:hypothetical protein [Candidatus Pacearchaeota archaeon]
MKRIRMVPKIIDRCYNCGDWRYESVYDKDGKYERTMAVCNQINKFVFRGSVAVDLIDFANSPLIHPDCPLPVFKEK